MKYYVAYGSNLNVRQMLYRCPTARVVGTGEIPDYELLFKGSKTGSYLTIEKSNGTTVPVAIWAVTKQDELALDRYEGFPIFYYKKEIQISMQILHSNKRRTVNAFVYIMHENRPIGLPTNDYVQTCAKGYATFGFDLMHLQIEMRTAICPLCGNEYHGIPALSRIDNATGICPDCGSRQALATLGITEEEQEKILHIIHQHSKAE